MKVITLLTVIVFILTFVFFIVGCFYVATTFSVVIGWVVCAICFGIVVNGGLENKPHVSLAYAIPLLIGVVYFFFFSPSVV